MITITGRALTKSTNLIVFLTYFDSRKNIRNIPKKYQLQSILSVSENFARSLQHKCKIETFVFVTKSKITVNFEWNS